MMFSRVPTTVRVGLALILAPLGWTGAWTAWGSTRIWVPLDVPASLSQVHTEFMTNVGGHYSFAIVSASLAKISWSVSDKQKVLARGDNEPAWETPSFHVLGTFDLAPGRYRLDLNVVDDGIRQNAYDARLVIFENGGSLEATRAQVLLGFLAFVVCAPVGVFAIIQSAVLRRAERHAAFLGSRPFTQPGSFGGSALRVQFRRAVRSPVARPFSSLSMTSMILVLVLVTILTFFVGLHSGDRVPTGLRIHISRPGVVAQRVAGIQPIRVRVASTGVYLNFHLVDRDDFGSFLRTELDRRPPNWPVYVEGDPNLEWKSVAQVIDAIRGQQAEVVLLTHGN